MQTPEMIVKLNSKVYVGPVNIFPNFLHCHSLGEWLIKNFVWDNDAHFLQRPSFIAVWTWIYKTPNTHAPEDS